VDSANTFSVMPFLTRAMSSVDDAELNEVLARSEEEAVIFAQIDEERRRNEHEIWGRLGRPVPERLIAEAELPDLYRLEHVPEAPKGDVIEDSEGGRRRNKPTVYYDDGLREDEFLAVSVDDRLCVVYLG
jgi:ATP-dependent helicase STH1/SNF2